VGLGLEALYVLLARAPRFSDRPLLFYGLYFSAVLLALAFARRAGPRAALLFGLVFRATLWFRPPDLSSDVYRYAWDGRIGSASVSPYAFAPDDPRLARLRDRDWSRLEHRDAKTVYPPAAQAVFRLAACFRSPVRALKTVFGLADLAVVALLASFPGGAWAAALYAAFPLAVVESAGMGHLDSLGVALLLASLLYLGGGRRAASGAALALSALVKYVSAFALLPLLRRGRAPMAAALGVCAAAVWLLGARGGASPASGLANFATRWEGNSVVYPVVEKGLEAARIPQRAKTAYAAWKSRRPPRAWMQRVWPYFYPAFFARAALALVLGVGLAWIAWRVSEPVVGVAASITLLLVLSPVLHPWYALWILPFGAILRRASLLYLSAAVALAYALQFPVPFLPPPVVLAVEYAPFAALLYREAR
jgi:alpha-1,6-mannosyltransferase